MAKEKKDKRKPIQKKDKKESYISPKLTREGNIRLVTSMY